MPLDRALPFALFFIVMSITPGPNNVMLLASGVNFGFRRTIPHMFGICAGLVGLIAAVGIGLGQVFERLPVAQTALKVAGVVYLLYLAWRLATSAGGAASNAGARPMTFFEAALFQCLNPKAWVMALSAVATYAVAGSFATSLVAMTAIILVVTPASMTPWVAGGVALRRALQDERKLRTFNVTMAVLLAASLWPIVAELLPGRT